MKKSLQKLGLTAIVILAGAGIATAQDSRFNVDFKFRAGQELGKGNDNLDKKMLGAGLSFGYRLPYGTVNAEVGFQYKSGKQYLNDASGVDVAAGQFIDWSLSPDSRKNTMDGITLRLSYAISMPVDKLSLQAGVQVGGAKFRQEYFGDIEDTPKGKPVIPTYRDSYTGVITNSSLGSSLSPFVGLSYRLDEVSSLEVNVLVQRFESINYRHVAGTVPGSIEGGNIAQDYTVLAKRTAPHVEIGYTFRF